MRVLVLGAGAVGGYFGGRLAQAGAAEEVAFLVRPGRKARLERDGLAIESPSMGDWRGAVRTLLAEEVGPGWDVVLLACKAYDLEAAIAALRPAVDGRTAVLPLPNGMSHVDALEAAWARAACSAGWPKCRRRWRPRRGAPAHAARVPGVR